MTEAAAPRTHPGPFEWSMTESALRLWLILPLVYLGAFFSGLRPARWFGSRLLPLLSVALAIPPKRSSSSLGVFVSIVMVVAYHKINEYGESVASLGRIDPTLALWGPFAVFAAIIVWMYYRVAFVPGAQAIGALETAFARIVKLFKRLTRRRRRSHQMGMVADAV